MILTLTANPSVDRTASLDRPLTRGAVHRVEPVCAEAGGKGVNVAQAVHHAGLPVRAVLPAGRGDPVLRVLAASGLPHSFVELDGPVRTNLTLTEADGTTTKINEPGPNLSAAATERLGDLLVSESARADWVVLAGSLPPGVPAAWYAELVPVLRRNGCRVAVDTADAPLIALADRFPEAAPDLLTPNAAELLQLEAGAPRSAGEAVGDPDSCLCAGRSLLDRGVGEVLITLGAAGAVLVTAGEAWRACQPPIGVRNTVGAGDAALAGYLMAETRGFSAPERLRWAVAWGGAAASMPGTTPPTPDQVDTSPVVVVACE